MRTRQFRDILFKKQQPQQIDDWLSVKPQPVIYYIADYNYANYYIGMEAEIDHDPLDTMSMDQIQILSVLLAGFWRLNEQQQRRLCRIGLRILTIMRRIQDDPLSSTVEETHLLRQEGNALIREVRRMARELLVDVLESLPSDDVLLALGDEAESRSPNY